MDGTDFTFTLNIVCVTLLNAVPTTVFLVIPVVSGRFCNHFVCMWDASKQIIQRARSVRKHSECERERYKSNSETNMRELMLKRIAVFKTAITYFMTTA